MNLFRDNYDATHTARRNMATDLQGIRSRRAQLQAGQAMAAGDQQGAAGVLYGDGQLDAGAAIEDRAARQEQQQYERGRTEKADQDSQKLRDLKITQQAAQALRKTIAERGPEVAPDAWDRLTPVFNAMGSDPETLAQYREAFINNPEGFLDVIEGEVESQIKLFNTATGVVAVDQGALNRDMNDPNASRVVYQDPLGAEYKRAQIEATRARAGASGASAEAARARAYRTMHPTSKGGGGGGGATTSPTLQAIEAALRKRGKL